MRFAGWLRGIGLLLLAMVAASAGWAQTAADVAGDYGGTLGPLHLKLHLKADAQGVLSGTLDSPDQGAAGIECADFKLEDGKLSFAVPAVHGTWKGTAAKDGTLTGEWNQGNPMPLVFKREMGKREAAFVPAAKPSAVDGIWLGTLDTGGGKLRVQLTVKSDSAGKEFCSNDSLDQGAAGLECANVQFKGENFSFEVPVVNGKWTGKLSADGKELTGTWNQGSDLALNFTRQAAALPVVKMPEPKFDAAMAPVGIGELKQVLDKDFAELTKNELAPGKDVGIAIAVVEHGERRLLTYGAAKDNSIFEIGSITKTFTGLVLAQMAAQGKVKMDEPVRELLPAGTVAKPEGREITLLDLATQHSGLPRMPDNFHPADGANPYVDYKAANLYAFVKEHGVSRPADAKFLYSNVGFGLLGQALANRAGTSYAALLKDEVTGPLGLKDTVIALSPEELARFMPGHDGDLHPAHAWDLDAFAGAGAIRSTAGEMLSYLEAQLHPDKVKAVAGFAGSGTLKEALEATHSLHDEAMPGMKIGLAWLYETGSGIYWHNGATGGYSSYAFFDPQHDRAAVVLVNVSPGKSGLFADLVGQHLRQRLAGEKAISLGK